MVGLLQPLAALELGEFQVKDGAATYWYEGYCASTQQWRRLPRTPQAEAIAQRLMARLATDDLFQREGKMYGVLLVQTLTGDLAVLKAFSGLLAGQSERDGWVPPIPGRAHVALQEKQTLRQLETWKAEIVRLQQLPERVTLENLTQQYTAQLSALKTSHRQRKQVRDQRRQTYAETLQGEALAEALAELIRQSQQDGIEKRRLKRERDAALRPLQATIAQADDTIRMLKRQRQQRSRQLQTQMHAVYALTNFAGDTSSLRDLWPSGLPTGTGDCAAPKLLHYAATHHLQPMALAEFWWGPAEGHKRPGHFYGACAERCQPIMGFLLSGLAGVEPIHPTSSVSLTVLYEDDYLLAIAKPSGLLSVPGRTHDVQDSVLSRLRCQRPESYLATPHRLDKGTSGILLVAKTAMVHRQLSAQFAQRKVKKVYEALLSRPLESVPRWIDLPLWRDPGDRPKTCVNLQYGKPSQTACQLIAGGHTPRLRLNPHTGRTHQLRVHAAHPQGLNSPILGDTLYGAAEQSCRLHLHATELKFTHPTTGGGITLSCPVPF
jgi:tRNA pseudouridine32 synthase/23S rRNA pseudouridine746 synthase